MLCFSCVRNFCLMLWRPFSMLPFTVSSTIYLAFIFEYGENYSFRVGLLITNFTFFSLKMFFISNWILKVAFFRYKILYWQVFLWALSRCGCIVSGFHYFFWEVIYLIVIILKLMDFYSVDDFIYFLTWCLAVLQRLA